MLKNERMENDLQAAMDDASQFTKGAVKVLREYYETKRNYVSNELVLEDILWEENYNSALNYLKECQVESFIITNASTELMQLLFFFLSNGYEVAESVVVEKVSKSMFNPLDDYRKGLRLRIK